MDLKLTDEQVWLSEAIDTLLDREWITPERVTEVTAERRQRVWDRLVEFGALTIGHDDGLGAIELCLIARSLGARLVSVPFLASAALRLALEPLGSNSLTDRAAVALAILEPGASWGAPPRATTMEGRGDGTYMLRGEKVAVEQSEAADQIAVIAAFDAQPALALTPASARGVTIERRPSFDRTLTSDAIGFDAVAVPECAAITAHGAAMAIERLTTVGALLAAAEAIGAAGAALEQACHYARERRQFGQRIASFQAVRHLLADAYVRHASGWSTVLYAAAAFDDGADDAGLAASVAKAYVSRGALQVAHDAMQVFGGIAFTAEHPAHHFLRRIVVREQQFGDAAHHERALGRMLAEQAAGTAPPLEALVR